MQAPTPTRALIWCGMWRPCGMYTPGVQGRVHRLLALVGDPHKGMRVVHVAGTKGKGSVSTCIARICQAAGYRTGLYTR